MTTITKRYEEDFLLCCACSDHGGEVVSIFVDLGVDLSFIDTIFNRDAYGWLALSHRKDNAVDIAKKIHEAGYKNFDVLDKFGKSPRHYAIEFGNNSLYDFFNQWSDDRTPIHGINNNRLVTLFSNSSIQKEKERHGDEQQIQKRLSDLEEAGALKELVSVNSDTIKNIRDLKINFPHFSSVIDHIVRSLSLQVLGHKKGSRQARVRIPAPILIHGGPGSGKTRFVNQVATVLKTTFATINCGNTTPKSAFSGTPPTYLNADCSKVIQAIEKNDIINPVILMDELDKLSSPDEDPYGPLYALLESYQAKVFRDQFFNVEFDLSHILWFATANELEKIPEPILSRMDHFEIENPDWDQTLKITDSIYKDLRENHYEDFGRFFPEKVTLDILNYMTSYTPREIKSIIQRSFGFAAQRSLEDSEPTQYNINISDVKNATGLKKQKTQIGF